MPSAVSGEYEDYFLKLAWTYELIDFYFKFQWDPTRHIKTKIRVDRVAHVRDLVLFKKINCLI